MYLGTLDSLAALSEMANSKAKIYEKSCKLSEEVLLGTLGRKVLYYRILHSIEGFPQKNKLMSP